ncbi:MAG: nucleotidyltransferase family protein [Candidatus Binatia bacterium]
MLRSRYSTNMLNSAPALSPDDLRRRLRPFCEKHKIRRLEVFGSAANGQASPSSDVDLLVTLAESASVSTDDLLEMAGEAEELVGRPVDFVLRHSLEKSPNRFAREHILATAVCLYGN